MSKKKNNKKVQKNNSSSARRNIDEKILAQEIIKAYEEYECNKKAEKEEIEQKIQEEWLKTLGQKKYPENENWFLKRIHEERNIIVGLYKLLVFKRKDAKDPRATFALMSLVTISIFSICKWVLYICMVWFIWAMITQHLQIVVGCAYTFIFLVLARAFRVATFEIENIRDGNLLINIFSGALSFVGIVIAVIALFINKI